MKIELRLSNSGLTIAPCPPVLKTLLTYKEKQMGGGRTKTQAFSDLVDWDKSRATPEMLRMPPVITYQGFWSMVMKKCQELGWEVAFLDVRDRLPKPRLDLTGGMRFSQPRLLRQALEAECSGLIVGPTRYGKTPVLFNICRAFPGFKTLITAPGADLVRQLYEDAKRWVPEREIKMMGGGRKSARIQSDDISIISIDSLHLTDKSKTELIIADEVHASVTNTRLPQLSEFTLARRYGLSATPGRGIVGRFDNRDLLVEGLFGPVLSSISYLEAVAEGAICPIEVVMVKYRFDPWNCSWPQQAMSRLLHKNQQIASITRLICDHLLPESWQTLLFIKNEEHAEFMAHELSQSKWPVAMAKLLTKKERDQLGNEVKTAEHNRVLCSDIYSQGMTFPEIKCLVNLSGGGPYTTTIQKPGRLAEIRPGKKCGIMVDFMPVPAWIPSAKDMKNQDWWLPVKNAEARLNCYNEIGYGVHLVENPGQLKSVFAELTK